MARVIRKSRNNSKQPVKKMVNKNNKHAKSNNVKAKKTSNSKSSKIKNTNSRKRKKSLWKKFKSCIKNFNKKFKKTKCNSEKILKQHIWTIGIVHTMMVITVGYVAMDALVIKPQKEKFYKVVSYLHQESSELHEELAAFKAREVQYLASLDELKSSNSELEEFKNNLQNTTQSLKTKVAKLKEINEKLNQKNKTLSVKLEKQPIQQSKVAQPNITTTGNARAKLDNELESKLSQIKETLSAEDKNFQFHKQKVELLASECQNSTGEYKNQKCREYKLANDDMINLKRKITFMKAQYNTLSEQFNSNSKSNDIFDSL